MSVKKKKRIAGWIILIVVVALAAGFVFIGLPMLKAGQPSLINVRTAEAEFGTIEKTVSGTGNLTAEDVFADISVEDNLEIAAIAVESGDAVKKGDVLATFDAMSLQTAIWDTQDELGSLDARINQVRNKTESTYLLASVAGRIKQILVNEGDSVIDAMQDQGALIVLSIDGKMRVSFVPERTDGLAGGDDVLVVLSDGTEIAGTIESISQTGCVVTLPDKTPEVNDAVKVTLADGTALGMGNLEINRPIVITGIEGTVQSVLKSKNDLVSVGTRLVQLEQGTTAREYLELAAARSVQLERLRTLLGYASQNDALTASADGVIGNVSLAEGQTTGSSVSAGLPATPAFTIKTDSTIKLSVNIDELDITLVTLGMKAKITVDALPANTLEGSLVEIADNGTASQGGTAYAATIELPADQSLKQGMTATAVITVERRESIVRIPLEALQESGKEQYVFVGTAVSSTELGEKRVVKTGISDGQYVEIISGLNSGEEINYYYASSSSLNPFGNNGGLNAARGTAATGEATESSGTGR